MGISGQRRGAVRATFPVLRLFCNQAVRQNLFPIHKSGSQSAGCAHPATLPGEAEGRQRVKRVPKAGRDKELETDEQGTSLQ